MDNIEQILRYLEKLDSKVDAIKEDTGCLKVEQAKHGKDISRNADDLKVHMKRTKLLEDRMCPLEKHVNMWSGVGKALGVISVVSGIIFGIFRLL